MTQCAQKQEEEIRNLEKTINELTDENTPIKFKITRKTNEKIYTTVKFYDTSGQEVGTEKFELTGRELAFDFISVPVGMRFLSFPYKIFTDQIAPDDGLLLYDYYEKDGFPAVYSGELDNPELYRGIQFVYENIRKDNAEELTDYYGNMVHDVESLQEFETGVVYRIITKTKGGIEIIKD